MKMNNVAGPATLLLALVVLAGCSRQDAATAAAPATQPAPIPAPAPVPQVCNSCGVVRSVTAVTQEGRATGAGAVIGGIVGGVAGNQVGGGSGKKIATAAGVIGGALLGNDIEQNRNATSQYEVVIDMENGSQQYIMVPNPAGINPGSRVTVNGGNISLR